VAGALPAICTVCRAIPPIDIDTHTEALRVVERYRLACYAALAVAAALRADCRVR